jgi:general stress protein 26
MKWTMKNGKKIEISKMTTFHLENSLYFASNNDNPDIYEAMIKELEKRKKINQELKDANIFKYNKELDNQFKNKIQGG